MRNKELLDRINKIKSPIVRGVFLEAFNRGDSTYKKKLAKTFEKFENRLKNDINFKAKAIAAYVRYNMEDFHSKHLTNAQMKELNPLIRNAIFTFLKDEADGDSFDISCMCQFNLAPYWEDCEYIREIYSENE